jgi:hypothetical protein
MFNKEALTEYQEEFQKSKKYMEHRLEKIEEQKEFADKHGDEITEKVYIKIPDKIIEIVLSI